MNPRLEKVEPMPDYFLKLWFTNQEVKYFDTKPYLSKGVFQELKSPQLFNSAKVIWGTVVWNNDIDLCPDTLYLESKVSM